MSPAPQPGARKKTQNHRSGKLWFHSSGQWKIRCSIKMWACHAKYIVTILIKCFNRAWYSRCEIYSLFSCFCPGLDISASHLVPGTGCVSLRYLARLLSLVIDDLAIPVVSTVHSVQFTRGPTFCQNEPTRHVCRHKIIQWICQDSINISPKMLIAQYFLCSWWHSEENQTLMSSPRTILTFFFFQPRRP